MTVWRRKARPEARRLRFDERTSDEDDRRDAARSFALQPVGRRPPFREYARSLWQRRHFIWEDSRARAFSGNGGLLLGNAWLVLSPLLDGFTYFLIFGLLLGTSRGIDNYIGYLLIGVFLFHYTGRAHTGGAAVLHTGRNLIRGFSFPRIALPVSMVLREMVAMVPILGVMTVMILAIPPHAEVSWRWLLFPAVFALQTVFNLGSALVMARISVHVPDVRKVMGFFTRLWMMASAVMFSYERYVEDPLLLRFLEANPAFVILDMSRDLLLYATTPTAGSWLMLGAWAVGTLTLGTIVFWQAEEHYGRA